MKTTTTTTTTHQSPAVLALLAALLMLATPAARAASLTWDTVSGDGATITAGSGSWNLTGGNTVWNSGSANVIWSQAGTTDGANTATFAGADGTLNQYVVTLGAQMAAESITFNSSGYQIIGSTLALMPTTTTSGPIDVAAGKTATINSILRYAHNTAANVSVGSGGTLSLGGGTTASFNPQFTFSGAGTINLTAGTFTQNIGNMNNAAINLTGGTHAITPGNNNGVNIGNNVAQNVNYTVSGTGTLTVNNNASSGTGTGNSWLRLGLGDTTSYEAKLTVQTGGTVTMGSGKYGELQISGSATSSGKLDVQGGTVTIAAGVPTDNKIYFFKSGSTAGYSATMTQSGGTVTANGIQFGNTTGTFDTTTSSSTLQLSGGSLYVGTQGITLGSAAASMPYSIKLQGGTLGADQNWSSSLDMKLGTTGGGPIIRAQNSASTARNIILSGILSDDTAVNGTLTKTGGGTLTLSGASANTFTGPTLVSAGTLDLGKASAVSSSSSVTIASGAALALSTSSSTVPNLTFANTGTLSFNVAGGYSLTVSAANGVTNSGAASSVTINITGSAPANGTYTLIAYSGALQGSGFSAYTLGSTPAGKSYKLNDTGSAVQVVVSSPYVWTGLESSEWSTAAIGGSKNWTSGGSPADYTDGQTVVFDATATGYTVDLSVADVTPASVTFTNSGATPYTLQGSKAIAGSTALSMSGSQTLTILNANTYTGGSTLGQGSANIGTVGIGHNSALGAGKITALGAQLQAIGADRTLANAVDIGVGALRFGGDYDLNLSGAITLVGGQREIGIYSAARTLTLSGGVDLNGNNLVLRGDAGDVPNGTMVFSAPITGSGNFVLSANFTNGVATLTATNTYNGTTTISGGTLTLADDGQLKFIIGNNGVNNQINGSGTVNLDGDFNLDLTGAATAPGNSWTLVVVGTLTETFGSTFTVTSTAGAFTETAPGVWKKQIDGTKRYVFAEATGVLSVQANNAPVAQAIAMGTRAGVLTPLQIIGGKHSPTDIDGDTLTLQSVSYTTGNGATVAVNGNNVEYTALSSFSGTDIFDYTVSDGFGGTDTQIVTVTVTSANAGSPNVVFGPTVVGSDFVVRFAGVPGTAYTVETNGSLGGPGWAKFNNYTAPTELDAHPYGVGIFQVTKPNEGEPSLYFRTIHPSY